MVEAPIFLTFLTDSKVLEHSTNQSSDASTADGVTD